MQEMNGRNERKIGRTQMKTMGRNMKNQFLKSSTTLAALALFTALTIVPQTHAQNYGPWSAPVNLNNLTMSDGITPCPFKANSAFNASHPAISKDELILTFATPQPAPATTDQPRLANSHLCA